MSNKVEATFHPLSEPNPWTEEHAPRLKDDPDGTPDETDAAYARWIASKAIPLEPAEVTSLCDALDAATARAEVAERNARMAWDVHSEHVDMMNRRILHEQAVRDEAQGQRDRARGTAALLEAEVARLEHDRAHPYGELAESGEPR